MGDDAPRGERETTPADARLSRGLLGGSLVVAMLVGVWMRWALAGAVPLALPFAHLRHAHSHLGYYGLLFPLAWLGWGAVGARTPGRGALVAYAVGTALAFVGFVRSGYGPIAIAASTFVAGFWLWSAAALRARARRLFDPLGGVPLGVVLSLACVPPIAIFLRRDPTLAHGFVSTFLSALLFLVIIPSALAARRISPGPWPVVSVVGALGALYLGVAPNAVTRAGLLAYAGLVFAPALRPWLELHVRAPWAVVSLGLAGMALGALPNTRPVALGAIHFVILGPVLTTLAPLWLKRPPPGLAWWLGHVAWGSMSAALTLQAFVSSAATSTLAAVGGTATLVWWAAVLAAQGLARAPAAPREAAGGKRG